MNRTKKWIYIAAVFVVVISSIALYIYKEYNRKNSDTAGLEADYTVAAPAIIKEFEMDDSSAGKKYTDKIILAEGMVKDILKDDRGFYSVMLGDTASMSSVKCSMDSSYNYGALKLQKGSYTKVKGVCAGFNADELLGSDVILVRCVIDKKNK